MHKAKRPTEGMSVLSDPPPRVHEESGSSSVLPSVVPSDTHADNDSDGESEPESDDVEVLEQVKRPSFFAALCTAISHLCRAPERDEFAHVAEELAFPEGVYTHPMDRPLHEYFVSSGHNSYLEGNQLTGRSSTKIIVESLRNSCRVIELDAWDSKQGPRVLHGGTLTSGVMLGECLAAIRDNAFVSSPYPVILTIENHCNLQNQEKMAEQLKAILGEMLWVGKASDTLPSPEALKHRVLYRDKHPDDHPKKAIHPALSALISMRNVKHKRATAMRSTVSSSRNEKFVKTMLKDHRATVCHTRTHVIRVYPRGKRVDSSNFDPSPAWSAGSQVVALNWQSKAEPLWVNQGLFLQNGRSGYVHRPAFQLQDDKYRNVGECEVQRTLKVSVLSIRNMSKRPGFHIPLLREECYVRVELYGAPLDGSKQKTRIIKAFDKCTFDQHFFFPMRCPETAVLLIAVMDYEIGFSDDYLAHIALPCNALPEGDFVVPLLNRNCQPINAGKEKQFSVVANFEWIKGHVTDSVTALTVKNQELKERLATLQSQKLAQLHLPDSPDHLPHDVLVQRMLEFSTRADDLQAENEKLQGEVSAHKALIDKVKRCATSVRTHVRPSGAAAMGEMDALLFPKAQSSAPRMKKSLSQKLVGTAFSPRAFSIRKARRDNAL